MVSDDLEPPVHLGSAEAYDTWFRAKVTRAIESTGPGIPHDQVMAEVQAIIDNAKRR